MSAYLAQEPVYEVKCDHVGCPSFFRVPDGHSHGLTERGIRISAERAGWDVPPWRGKGSRRGTDFCPQHAGGGASS